MDDCVCSSVKKPPPAISQWGIYFLKFLQKLRKFGAFLGDFFAPENFPKKRCHPKKLYKKIWISKIHVI
jgi:hypothetical protein